MLKRIIVGIVLLTSIFAVACSGTTATGPSVSKSPNTSSAPKPAVAQTQEKPAPTPKVSTPKPEGPIKAIWVDPTVKGDMVYVPIGQVEKNWNVNFKYGDMNFMAYVYNEDIYVRANVCPPCRSIGFSLVDDILVCDRCATVFEAKTGDGVQGACVDFPKASVKYTVQGDNLVMTKSDLSAAYQETLNPG